MLIAPKGGVNDMRFRRIEWMACVLLTASAAAHAQPTYPANSITLILPYAPGGSTSALGYLLRPHLADSLGQQIVILHRPGGSSTIGAATVAKAAPDGYTLALVTATHVISPMFVPVHYDAIKDFTAVATVANAEVVLAAHPSFPAKQLKDLIAIARARPGQINYATASFGSPSHLAAELFSIRVGIRMQNVPYKGGSPAVTDLLGGQVELMFGNPINVVTHVKNGRLKALAISGKRRLPSMPGVPTFGEGGVENFDVGFWLGLVAPAGTPRPIVDKWAAAVKRILAVPDIREKMEALGSEPYIATPDLLAARMRADASKYADVIKRRNIRLK
jgi:tripartite-type tricarboxylate transporter receptor subunit TctC